MARSTKPPAEAVKPLHDTAKEGDGKAYGLLLDARRDPEGNPTVPAVAHNVLVNYPERGRIVRGEPVGEFLPLPGFYRWDRPTPVGAPGECPLDLAVKASKQDGCGVTLVELEPEQVNALRVAHAEDIGAAVNAVTALVKDADNLEGGDLTRLVDEAGAAGQEV